MIDSTTMKTFKQGVARGLGIGVGISIALATTSLLAAAAAMKIFSTGEVISASELNRNFIMAAPEREVSAFDLDDCPEGWTLADGTNGTHDLRGRFIRGLDKVGAGAANVDPQSALRTLGHEQMDAFQGHKHDLVNGNTGNTVGNNAVGLYYHSMLQTSKIGDPIADDHGNGDPRTSAETRPRNVALIYCMRKN